MALSVSELTGFQRDLLYVIYGLNRPSGQDIKGELEREHGEITHGQLYPNLDTLVEKGFVDKGSIDRRTNFYEVTPRGERALRERERWESQYLDF